MAFTIRKAAINDAESLSRLGRDTFYETWKGTATDENLNIYMDESYNVDRIINELSDDQHTYFILEDDGKIIGYAKMEIGIPPKEVRSFNAIEINKLYLASAYKGIGLGKKLMNACLDHAKKKGMNCIYLGVWEQNIRAVRLYKSYGFEEFGKHAFVMGTQTDTDLWMKLMI